MNHEARTIVTEPPLWRVAYGFAFAAVFWVSLVSPGVTAPQAPAAALQVFEVRPNVHVIAGAGSNITVQTGPDGVVLVDSGSGAQSDAVLAAIKALTDQPIRYIINTGPAAEHVGGNEALAKAGVSLFPRSFNSTVATAAADDGAGAASIVGTESLLTRMSAPGYRPLLPVFAWPTETLTRKHKDLFLNREAILVIRQPAAHSDSDAIVFFRRSDVIATGDIFDVRQFPLIDVARGGSIQGEIAALNALIELAVPSIPLPWLDEGGTRVVPGHGRLCEEAELVDYRDMVTIIRDRIRSLIGRGLTLEQVVAANPTQGFRMRYGTDRGPWTTDMFVEAVYRSLRAEGTR
jgi:cyclase